MATRGVTGLLYGAGEQTLDEVPLEGEEDRQRHGQRDERGRRDQLDVRAELAQLREDRDRDRLRLAPERERDEQVVPRPEELEDRERGDRRAARAGGSARRKIRISDAPSIRAASIRSFGMPMKKLRSRKIANGSPNAVWKSTSPRPCRRARRRSRARRSGSAPSGSGRRASRSRAMKSQSRPGNSSQANA